MKASIFLLTILNVLYASAWALHDPYDKIPTPNSLVVRADDEEWTVVGYPTKSQEGAQCGGTSTTETGSQSQSCFSLAKAVACVLFKVNVGFASCTLDVKVDSCDDAPEESITVDGGKDSNNVTLGTPVQFIAVTCELPE